MPETRGSAEETPARTLEAQHIAQQATTDGEAAIATLTRVLECLTLN